MDDIPAVVRSVSSEMPPRGESKATASHHIEKREMRKRRGGKKNKFVYSKSLGIIKGSARAKKRRKDVS